MAALTSDGMVSEVSRGTRLRVFVSYSRRDIEAADRLVPGLEAAGFDLLIDRRDLPYGEEWQKELADFIRSCDTVLWLVSSASLDSRWCNWELGEVQRLKKRLIPVAIEEISTEALPGALGKIHVLPAEGAFDFDKHFPVLVEALNADRGWLKEHTRLADRARQWLSRDRSPALLLRGIALKDAQAWNDNKPRDAPPITEEILSLLLASRRAKGRRERGTVAASLLTALIAVGLAGAAWWQREEAVRNATLAAEQRDEALRRQSLFLANLSLQQGQKGDYGTALALALEALPSAETGQRPYVPQAEAALYGAVTSIREGPALSSHNGLVTSVSFSSDGTKAVTTGFEGTAVVHDLATRRPVTVFKGHGQAVYSAEFSNDGTRILTASSGSALIWNRETGDELTRVRPALPIMDVRFSPDDRMIYVTTDDYMERWNATSGTLIDRGGGSFGSFSSDGRLTAASDGAGRIVVREVATGTERFLLAEEGAHFFSASFTESGARILTHAQGGSTVIWDAETGKKVATVDGSQLVASSKDGEKILTLSYEQVALVLSDAASGRRLASINIRDAHPSPAAAFSPDGSLLMSGAALSAAVLVDTTQGNGLSVLRGLDWDVSAAAYSPDGESVIFGLSDGRVFLCKGARETRFSEFQDVGARSIEYSSNGRWVVGRSDPGSILVWNAETRERVWLPSRDDEGRVTSILPLSSDGKLVAAVMDQGAAPTRIWNLETRTSGSPIEGRLSDSWQPHSPFSPDSRRVLSLLADNSIRVSDAMTGAELNRFANAREPTFGFYFSPDGKLIAVEHEKGVDLISSISGDVIGVLEIGAGPLASAFSPQGTQFVAAAGDTALVWDVSSHEVIATLKQRDEISFVQFSADGRELLTVSETGQAWLWDAGQQTAKAIDGPVNAYGLRISADWKHLLTDSADGSIRVFDLTTGGQIARLTAGTTSLSFADFSPDGRIVVAGNQSFMGAWSIFDTTQDLIDYARSVMPRELTVEQRQEFFLE